MELDTNNPKPGVYNDVPMSQYREVKALNHSLLRHIKRSPSHVAWAAANPTQPTEAQALGTALHVWALQRDLWDTEIAVALRIDRRTNEGKQAWSKFQRDSVGKTIITDEQNSLIVPMSKAIGKHADAARLRSAKGHAEVVIVWKDIDGILCKGRIDKTIETPNGLVRVDIKTTRSVDFRDFARDCEKFNYHTQDAFYRRGLESLGIKDAGEYIIAVETEPPHPVEVVKFGQATRSTADQIVTAWMSQYAKCVRENKWPANDHGIQEIDVPEWALIKEEIEV